MPVYFNRYQIVNVEELLQARLSIPSYQRPYKWSIRSTSDLISDINNAVSESEHYAYYKYRVGTIILHFNEVTGSYDIVDGQQRIISLLLIKLCLNPRCRSCSLLNSDFSSFSSQANIHNNYRRIAEWLSTKNDSERTRIEQAFSDILQVVVLAVSRESEAFQLFDSQNTRGKELDPHDLLKAYHLREMRQYPYEMQRAVTKWEAINPNEIKELFSYYLFPILNWTYLRKSTTFTAQDIDTYKGIPEVSSYSYAARLKKAMPAFQISESFIAGNNFFEMVEYYLYLLRFVKEEVYSELYKDKEIKKLFETNTAVGFRYAKQLFECAVLCYYDRFRNFEPQAINKIFTWAFMIRVDMENLPFDTINRYALGINDNNTYTNDIPMFSIIKNARMHTEISNLPIKVLRNPDEAKNKKNWNELYLLIKKKNGLEGVSINA